MKQIKIAVDFWLNLDYPSFFHKSNGIAQVKFTHTFWIGITMLKYYITQHVTWWRVPFVSSGDLNGIFWQLSVKQILLSSRKNNHYEKQGD